MGNFKVKNGLDIGNATATGTITPSAITGDRTYILPDVNGTIITTGDTGTVTSAMIVDGTGSGLDADLLDGMHAAPSNTINTIVSRDASGNFSAGTITASLAGNATTADKLNITELAGSVDLNTISTTGIYSQSQNTEAANGTNYPVPYAGVLEVFNYTGTVNVGFTHQRYWVYNSDDVYLRAKYSTGAWTTWSKQANLGEVVDKVTSTDNAIVKFNGVTGDVQNSGVTIDDSNNITIPGRITVGNATSSSYTLYNQAGTFTNTNGLAIQGVLNSITAEDATLTADRYVYGGLNDVTTNIQGNEAFSQNVYGSFSRAKTGLNAGYSLSGEGVLTGGRNETQFNSIDRTYYSLNTMTGTYSLNHNNAGSFNLTVNTTNNSTVITVTSGDISLVQVGDSVWINLSESPIQLNSFVLSKTATTITLDRPAVATTTGSVINVSTVTGKVDNMYGTYTRNLVDGFTGTTNMYGNYVKNDINGRYDFVGSVYGTVNATEINDGQVTTNIIGTQNTIQIDGGYVPVSYGVRNSFIGTAPTGIKIANFSNTANDIDLAVVASQPLTLGHFNVSTSTPQVDITIDTGGNVKTSKGITVGSSATVSPEINAKFAETYTAGSSSKHGIHNTITLSDSVPNDNRTHYGIYNQAISEVKNGSAYINSIIGAYNVAKENAGSNSLTYRSYLHGSYNHAYVANTTSNTYKYVADAVGAINAVSLNTATGYGIIDKAYGSFNQVSTDATSPNGAKINTAYGVYIINDTAFIDTNYGLYQVTTGISNYFASDVSVPVVTQNVVPNTAITASATLTGTQMKNFIVNVAPTVANITLTLHTGANMDAAFHALAINQGFEWVIMVGTGTTKTTTIAGSTGHTVVGDMLVPATVNATARFCTRKTATNTFVTYRIG